MRLIHEKPYAQITISELCKSAGISRQTFYTLFSSRENVVTFTLQAQYCYAPELPQFKTEEACSLRQLCRGYSNYIFRNRDLLRLLVENRIDYLLYPGDLKAVSYQVERVKYSDHYPIISTYYETGRDSQ